MPKTKKKVDSPFRKWRKKKGYGVEEFANLATEKGCATSANTAWRWDRGVCKPHRNTQRNLRALFSDVKF